MQKIIIVLIFVKQVLTFITYDTGLALYFDTLTYSNFVCQGGFSKTATIAFSNTFENTPQVFFTIEYFDQDTSELEFKLQITLITTTSFTVQISCSARRVYSVRLRWFALNDQRIEVINNFNMVNPDDKTFQVKNPNAQYGFVALTSMHFTGPLDFLLSITQITTNTVTVGITKVAGKFANLKQIGYQVVVGIEEAFINLGLKTVTGAFSSGLLPIQPNRWFAIATQGFNYSNSKNIRIKAIFSNTATTISYTWATWYEVDTPNSHSQIWIAYQFTNTFKPFECFTIRTSRKCVYDSANLPIIDLELVNTNQIYRTIGNFVYVVDKSITPFQINIQVKCQTGQKVVAQFNKCNSCSSQKNHLFSYYCSEQINYIGFFPKYRQAFQQYNQLKISMQTSSLEIIQVIYDQKITEQTIAKVEIMNQ